jgi:uncharacterized protein (DUF1778 family)
MASHSYTVEDREPKKERLEARVTSEQKKSIEKAARIRGTSVSDFVVLSAQDAAVRVIRDSEVLQLNEEAQIVFATSLMNPPAPKRSLLNAARRYKKRAGVR